MQEVRILISGVFRARAMDDQDEGLSGHPSSEGVDISEGSRDDARGDLVQLLCEVDIVLFHHYCFRIIIKE